MVGEFVFISILPSWLRSVFIRGGCEVVHCLLYMGTGIIALGIAVFWSSVGMGIGVTTLVIPILKKVQAQKEKDRKETLYGTEAVEFNKIRKMEEQEIKKEPVARIGGLTLLPTILFVGLAVAWLLQSMLLVFSVALVFAVALVALYDDLLDVGLLRGKVWRVRKRLLLLGSVAFVGGIGLYQLFPDTMITFLPFSVFEQVSVGLWLPVLFAAWYVFWQASSMIDGIDGLSGSVFLLLFLGTAVVSVLQGDAEPFILSALGAGVVVPWLFVNYAPAKVYLTEVGITILLMLYALISFLLGSGEYAGDGLWVSGIFGIVLIATWGSNVLQLLYRKKTGKKLFRIAPLHHHFEALGLPGCAVVTRYMLVTILSVMGGLSLLFLLQ